MRIIFDGLYDVKEFILMVDIYQWCDKEVKWEGLGYTIQNSYINYERKEEIIVRESDQSKVIRYGGGCVIVTPFYKQLSWLFNLLRGFVDEHLLRSDAFLDGFSDCCEEYFKKTPDHSAKELMVKILEYIQNKNDKENGMFVEKE